MNGGQVATRGFLLQTLIALLDLIMNLEQIETLRLEPATEEDKTDFVIEYCDGRTKAVQVKSSQNQMGLPSVKRWARNLKADLTVDEYELCLVGPCSGEVTKLTEVEGVRLPTPKSLDVNGMLAHASHLLDRYFNRNGIPSGSPRFRDLLVEGLIGKLSTFSTSGSSLKRSVVETSFREWTDAVEEQALKSLEKQYRDGNLTDFDALKEYSAHFDRPALQDTMNDCWNYKGFAAALGELIELLNTGKVRDKFVAKKRADFTCQAWREGLDDVYHEVRKLRAKYGSLVKAGDIDEEGCGCDCPQSVVDDFEGRKRKVTLHLNKVLADAGLPAIRGVS